MEQKNIVSAANEAEFFISRQAKPLEKNLFSFGMDFAQWIVLIEIC
jgi:hypothetical protein